MSARKQALTVTGVTVFLALWVTLDAATGESALDRMMAGYLGGIALLVVVGAAVARLGDRLMQGVTAVAAGLQLLLLAAMLVSELGAPGPVILLNGLLAAGYVGAAWLFGRARSDGRGRKGSEDGN